MKKVKAIVAKPMPSENQRFEKPKMAPKVSSGQSSESRSAKVASMLKGKKSY